MQSLGIVLISVGIWIVYCGYYGINPITTMQAVLSNPENSRKIIADARAATTRKLAQIAVLDATKVFASGENPYKEYKVVDTHEGHLKRGSRGGVDFAAPEGTPIVAPATGIVSIHPNAGAMGNAVFIKHQSGYQSEFYHLSSFKSKNGDVVRAGQIVGYSGGRKGSPGAGSSTGAHIHWTVKDPSGKQVDPLTVLGRL